MDMKTFTYLKRQWILLIVILFGACFMMSIHELRNTEVVMEVEDKSRETTMNNLLCEEDGKRFDMLRKLSSGEPNLQDFYQFVMYASQTGCNVLKRVGGRWHPQGGYDGSKYICLDDLPRDNKTECLAYSFGVGSDISFERFMSNLGCTVHAYDHTIKQELINKMSKHSSNLFIHRHGINATKTSKLVSTYEDILKSNGHINKTITYLKMDIESTELKVLPQLLIQGNFKNILQLGVEFHGVDKHFKKYLKIILYLYKEGFRIISFDPNTIASRNDNFFRFFELTFRKQPSDICR